MSRYMHCFLDADLRCGHEGLALVARKRKIDVKKLSPGQYVAFVNTARNKVKVFAAYDVVAYCRPDGGKITTETLARIPQIFLGPRENSFDPSFSELSINLKKETHVSPLVVAKAAKDARVSSKVA